MKYRGYQIERDADHGYIVKNGVVELAEFEFQADAKEYIDELKMEQKVNTREDRDYRRYCSR